MECKYCSGVCRKKGWYNAVQKYQCKSCFKYQRKNYSYQKLSNDKYDQLTVFHNEGLGFRSISRILHVPVTSVQRAVHFQSDKCEAVADDGIFQEYEVDEVCTFIKRNKPENYRYIAYAINRQTRKVIDFVIGRSKEKLQPLIEKLLSFSPSKIFTDGLSVYKSLIPENLHYSFKRCINRIERNNLTMRTHLKRLNRETICFSRSEKMLERSLQLYFFGSK